MIGSRHGGFVPSVGVSLAMRATHADAGDPWRIILFARGLAHRRRWAWLRALARKIGAA